MKLLTRRSAIALAACGLLACGSSSSSSGSGASGGSSGGAAGTSSGGSEGNGGGSLVGDGGSGSGGGTLTPDSGCATATATATRSPVYMLFVLDGSGSMGQENKWTAVTGALESLYSGMSSDPGIGVGLIVFSDSMDKTTNTGPGPYPEPGIDVPIGEVTSAQASALDGRLASTPSSNTPTYYALQGGYGELGTFVPASPLQTGGQKVLVLITDGVPTDHYCSTAHAGTDYPKNPCVQMAATQLAGAAPNGPILTFVIGTGQLPSSSAQDFDPAFLGNLALAGGGAPKGCDPNQTQSATNLCYFEVDPTQATSAAALEQQFTAALQAIRGQVLTCTFPLQSTGLGTVDPTKVNVQVDGMTVPQSATNGWTYDDPGHPTAIVFNGPACSALENDPSAKVSVILGCTTSTAL